MIFHRDGYELLTDETPTLPGSYVALGCPHPDCGWVSSRSRILDGSLPNELHLAFRAVEDEWERHWISNHQPQPIRLLDQHQPTESESE